MPYDRVQMETFCEWQRGTNFEMVRTALNKLTAAQSPEDIWPAIAATSRAATATHAVRSMGPFGLSLQDAWRQGRRQSCRQYGIIALDHVGVSSSSRPVVLTSYYQAQGRKRSKTAKATC